MRRYAWLVLPLLLAACALLAPRSATALGTLCGTVRDAESNAGIHGAGVFVFTTAGAYTGVHAATDESGAFCIGGIPAGTYDLEIRRDDYRKMLVRNVNVIDDVTGVEIGVTRRLSLSTPHPNPARNQVLFRFHLEEPAPARLEVLDLQGRLLKGWKTDEARVGERSVSWDFRDASGRVVPAGRYVVRLVAGGSTLARAFARVP